MSDAGTSVDEQFDPVVVAVEARVSEFIDISFIPVPKDQDFIWQIYNSYVTDLQNICASNTITHKRTAVLTEEEAIVGTIVEKTSIPRKRKDKMAKLRESTDNLVRGVREALISSDEEEFEAGLRRSWIAWRLALKEGDSFGAKSFGWVALGSVFEAVKEIEDALKF